MSYIPKARSGIENARLFSHPGVRQWGSEAPRPSLEADPLLDLANFYHYLTPSVDADPYSGKDPRFPRIRRAILQLGLSGIEPKIDKARQDFGIAHHLTSRQSSYDREFDMPNGNEPHIVKPISQLTGEPLPTLVGAGTSKEVKKIRNRVIGSFAEWSEENVKTFSNHSGAHHAAHIAGRLHDEFIEIPHEYGHKYKELIDTKAEKQQKLLAVEQAIANRQARRAIGRTP